MISYIEGTVIKSTGKAYILKTVSGVGHTVNFNGLLNEHEKISLFVTTVRRETGDEYFAFATYEEKEMYELLLTVKGVGPKTAYTLMSQLDRNDLIRAIALEDKSVFKSIPGIGPKTASQIILDLGNKIKDLQHTNLQAKVAKSNHSTIAPNIIVDATMALKELGYHELKINPILNSIYDRDRHQNPEALLKDALKHLN